MFHCRIICNCFFSSTLGFFLLSSSLALTATRETAGCSSMPPLSRHSASFHVCFPEITPCPPPSCFALGGAGSSLLSCVTARFLRAASSSSCQAVINLAAPSTAPVFECFLYQRHLFSGTLISSSAVVFRHLFFAQMANFTVSTCHGTPFFSFADLVHRAVPIANVRRQLSVEPPVACLKSNKIVLQRFWRVPARIRTPHDCCRHQPLWESPTVTAV